MLRILAWSVAVTLAIGCAAPAGGSGSPADEDCEEGDIAPWDVASPEDLLTLVQGVTNLRKVHYDMMFGLGEAEPSCPTWQGDDPGRGATGLGTWSGGCTTDQGATFEGSLSSAWTPYADGSQETAWSASTWVVAGGGAVERLELDGVWSATTLVDSDGEHLDREDHFEGSLHVSTEDGVHPLELAFPAGLSGSYDFDEDFYDNGDQLHVFHASLEGSCRGSAVVDFVMLELADGGACNFGGPGSFVEVAAGGRVARVDFAASENCLPCWPWTVDGVAQPDEICAP